MAIAIKQTPTHKKPERPRSLSVPRTGAPVTPGADRSRFTFGNPIGVKERLFFYSQLALMLEIGTSLTDALGAVNMQTKNPAFKTIIASMLTDIEEGRQLSDAMQRHPKVFSRITISLIKAGETGGFLKDTIERIVAMQEKRQAIKAQLRSTLTYPVVLCIVGFGVVLFLLVGILPKFTSLFAGKEALLPLSARSLIALSDSLKHYWWVYLAGGVGLGAGIPFLLRLDRIQAAIELIAIRVPVLARINTKIYTGQLLLTMGNLMESRVNMLEALTVTRATLANRYFRKFIDDIRYSVEQGGLFSAPFAANPFILESAKQMVATGEKAGNLPTVMLRLARFYETEIERELKILSSLIEPLALIILGAVVGTIVASVILPLFKIAGAVR